MKYYTRKNKDNKNILNYTRLYNDIQGYTRIIKNKEDYPRIYKTIQGYTRINQE